MKFAILLLMITLLLTPFTMVRAEEKITEPLNTEEIAATSPAEYKLPYPGMLPDHPLYKLKVLRDKIMLFLIFNPQQKAEKYIEFADKELFAALKLAEKGNDDLAIHTAFKGEHNMTMAVSTIGDMEPGEVDDDLVQKAMDAQTAHLNLLQGIKDQVESEDHKKSIDTIIEFSVRNDTTLKEIISGGGEV